MKTVKSRIRERAQRQRERRALQAAAIKARRAYLAEDLHAHLSFSVADVAGILGLSLATIYRLAASGELAAYKSAASQGGRWMVREQAIADLIASREKVTLDKALGIKGQASPKCERGKYATPLHHAA